MSAMSAIPYSVAALVRFGSLSRPLHKCVSAQEATGSGVGSCSRSRCSRSARVNCQANGRAAAFILELDLLRVPRAGRAAWVTARPRLDTGLLVRTEHVVVGAQGHPGPLTRVQVQHAPGLLRKGRVPGENPQPIAPGLQGV